MANKKPTATGKWIILLITAAILFFLILPFLDGSATWQSPRRAASKANPQIFTSNPLRRLADKLLSAFSRKNKKRNPPVIAGASPEQQAQLRAAAEAPLDFQQAAGPSAGPQDLQAQGQEDYDTSDLEAAFVNEDGEWILINQTDPESSNRGMHDIKFSDSPYDRLIRLERATKYTRPAAPENTQTAQSRPQHSDSAWERIWNPVKKFFGVKGEQPQMLAVGPISSRQNQAGRGANGAAATNTDFSISQYNIPANRANVLKTNEVLEVLLNPESQLEELAMQLKKSAHDTLPGKDAKKTADQIEKDKRAALAQMRQQILDKIESGTAGSGWSEVISKANTCIDHTPASAYQKDGCTTYQATPYEEKQFKNMEKLFQENAPKIQQTLSDIIGAPVTGTVPTVLLYAVTDAGESFQPATEDDDDNIVLYKEFLNYIAEKQGCGKEKCVWMALDNKAQTDLTAYYVQKAAGLDPKGLPEKQLYKMFQGFQEQKVKKEDVILNDDQVNKIRPQAWPVPLSQYTNTLKQISDTPPLLITTDDVQGKKLVQMQRHLGNIVQGNADLFAQQDSETNYEQSGAQLRQAVETHLRDIDTIKKNTVGDLFRKTVKNITRQAIKDQRTDAKLEI